MLVIRKEQMQRMEELMRSRLLKELMGGLAKIAPGLKREAIEAVAGQALDLGVGLGVTSGSGFGDLASLLLDLGDGFLRHPSIATVMSDGTLSVEERLAALFGLEDDIWAGVRADLADGESATTSVVAGESAPEPT